MITLHIDTSTLGETIVSLDHNGQTWEKRLTEKRAHNVLPIIEELLADHNLSTKDLTNIDLATGPGSYTGLRVGATIAGTLSLLMNIPINGNPPGKIPELQYGEDKYGLFPLQKKDNS